MPVINVDGYDYTWKEVGEGKEAKQSLLPLWIQDTQAELFRLLDLGTKVL